VEFVSLIGSLSTHSWRATRSSEMLLEFGFSEHSERGAVSLRLDPDSGLPGTVRGGSLGLQSPIFTVGHQR
jgi:hypothetical protein